MAADEERTPKPAQKKRDRQDFDDEDILPPSKRSRLDTRVVSSPDVEEHMVADASGAYNRLYLRLLVLMRIGSHTFVLCSCITSPVSCVFCCSCFRRPRERSLYPIHTIREHEQSLGRQLRGPWLSTTEEALSLLSLVTQLFSLCYYHFNIIVIMLCK